jgi:hypothetical protein
MDYGKGHLEGGKPLLSYISYFGSLIFILILPVQIVLLNDRARVERYESLAIEFRPLLKQKDIFQCQ